MKTNFQKKLQFRDIWPRNREKNCPNWGFWPFFDFASLAFFDFAHNDKWAWCLVVFLQFADPVNIFVFYLFYSLDFSNENIDIYELLFCGFINIECDLLKEPRNYIFYSFIYFISKRHKDITFSIIQYITSVIVKIAYSNCSEKMWNNI